MSHNTATQRSYYDIDIYMIFVLQNVKTKKNLPTEHEPLLTVAAQDGNRNMGQGIQTGEYSRFQRQTYTNVIRHT